MNVEEVNKDIIVEIFKNNNFKGKIYLYKNFIKDNNFRPNLCLAFSPLGFNSNDFVELSNLVREQLKRKLKVNTVVFTDLDAIKGDLNLEQAKLITAIENGVELYVA